MPWGALIGAGASILGGIFGGGSQKKLQAQQLADERAYRNRELDLSENQMNFAQNQYLERKAQFDPVLNRLLATYDDVEPDYAAIGGDVKSAFSSARGQDARTDRRFGIRPDDGLARQRERDYSIREGAAHVGARTLARQGQDDKKYARLSDIYGVGQGLQSNSAAQVAAAQAGASGAYGRAAGSAANNANQAGYNAAANASGIGQAIGSVDWGGIFNNVKGWFNNGTGATVAGSGGQTPQQFYSDARLKENIRKVGNDSGINIYTWDWNDAARDLGITDPTIGVIAQEHLDSGFVNEVNGYLTVDYAGLFGSRRLQ